MEMKKVKRVFGGVFVATLLLTGCGLQDIGDVAKLTVTRGYFPINATLPPTTTQPGLNIPPLLEGERVFLDASGGSFRIEGRLNDFEGLFGDPENNYDVTESYTGTSNPQPNTDYSGFDYGIKVLTGSSPNCAIDLEYTLEKIRDIRQWVP
jgi:hypothetical protein